MNVVLAKRLQPLVGLVKSCLRFLPSLHRHHRPRKLPRLLPWTKRPCPWLPLPQRGMHPHQPHHHHRPHLRISRERRGRMWTTTSSSEMRSCAAKCQPLQRLPLRQRQSRLRFPPLRPARHQHQHQRQRPRHRSLRMNLSSVTTSASKNAASRPTARSTTPW